MLVYCGFCEFMCIYEFVVMFGVIIDDEYDFVFNVCDVIFCFVVLVGGLIIDCFCVEKNGGIVGFDKDWVVFDIDVVIGKEISFVDDGRDLFMMEVEGFFLVFILFEIDVSIFFFCVDVVEGFDFFFFSMLEFLFDYL